MRDIKRITGGDSAEISLAVNGNVSYNRTVNSSDGLVGTAR